VARVVPRVPFAQIQVIHLKIKFHYVPAILHLAWGGCHCQFQQLMIQKIKKSMS